MKISIGVSDCVKEARKLGDLSWNGLLKVIVGVGAFAVIGVTVYEKYLKLNNQYAASSKKESDKKSSSDVGKSTSNSTDEPLLEVTPICDVPSQQHANVEEIRLFGKAMHAVSGYGIIAGPQNEGKSTLVRDIVVSMASGKSTGLMAGINEDGLKPRTVYVYNSEQTRGEMLKLLHEAYPDISRDVEKRIQVCGKDTGKITVKKVMAHVETLLAKASEDIYVLYDCMSSDKEVMRSWKEQDKIREQCDNLMQLAEKKGIKFQIDIVVHTLGGSFRIGIPFESNDVNLSDTLIEGSKFILGIAPIKHEHSVYKYIKVMRCKQEPEPDKVAVIRWADNMPRFEHVCWAAEEEALSMSFTNTADKGSDSPKKQKGAPKRVSDQDIKEARANFKTDAEAAKSLGITPSALSQRVNKKGGKDMK